MADASGEVGVDCDGKHDPQDYLIHYTKCLEFYKREGYLEKYPNRKERLESEIRRIKFLRKTIEKDEDDVQLSTNLKSSLEKWRGPGPVTSEPLGEPTSTAPEPSRNNIGSVQQWREKQKKANGQCEPGLLVEDNHGDDKYEPEIDFNGYLISYENSQPVKDLGDSDSRIQGSFPNHKISMSNLLKEEPDRNPLTLAKGGERIDYFHIPANNMRWVEKAMSRYYGEGDLNYDEIDRKRAPEGRTEAYMLLRPQFWKGQEYGSRSAIVHARHMRPICEIISTKTKRLDSNPNNIVLFCPYLHWETDRYRDRISHIIGQQEESERIRKELDVNDALDARRLGRGGLLNPITNRSGEEMRRLWKKNIPKASNGHDFAKPIRTFSSALHGVFGHHPKIEHHFESKLFHRDPKTGRIMAGHMLGQVLIDAARLYEAMSCYRDKALIKNYLHDDPPLHPRRTLDQAYYCTLKTTKWRDRDQVVYRGTRANPAHLHSVDPVTKEFNCPARQDISKSQSLRNAGGKHSEVPVLSNEDYEALKLAYKCLECTEHVRKVARLIMVDQLWMWVLDGKTLITSFPRRYGVNKKDPSGVHHLVRKHLRNAREDQIRTVFDLALIVLVETTNIFFDRAKTPDHQPQVIDIFADAIGEITNKQAVAFNHLWVWTSKIVNLASPNAFSDITAFVFPLLNINPEGKLQREVKDIIDELDIMLLISRQQLTVIRKFIKHAEDVLDPQGLWRDRKGTMYSTSEDLSAADLATMTEEEKSTAKLEKKKTDYLWFKAQAEEVISDLESHIEELEGLRASAVSTSSSLDNLLGLMQQQASALQAWQSARQAEETVKQGRAIMMFTTVTIIFLPLSFMTGVFGMNNKDFSDNDDGNTMTFRQQLTYMLPISLSIILLAVGLAYVARSRPLVAIWWDFCISWLVIKSGAYRMSLNLTWKRDKWVRKTDRLVRDMKKEVQKRMQKRMEVHLQPKRDDIDNGASGGDNRGTIGTASGSEHPGRGAKFLGLFRGSRSSPSRHGTGGVTTGTDLASKAPLHDAGSAMVSSASNGHASSTGVPDGPSIPLQDVGGRRLSIPSAGQHGAAVSGTTLAAPTTNTSNPAQSSTPNLRGGGTDGENGFRFWEISFGDSMV